MNRRVRFSFLAQIILIAGLSSAADGRPYIRQIGNVPMTKVAATPMVGVSTWGAEIGAKGSYRISENGFIPVINNSVNFEGAVFLSSIGEGTLLALAPLLRWDFHVHPQWTVYASGGLELLFPTQSEDGIRRRNYARADVAAGGIWHVKPDLDLRGEFDLAHDSARAGIVLKL